MLIHRPCMMPVEMTDDEGLFCSQCQTTPPEEELEVHDLLKGLFDEQDQDGPEIAHA